MIPTGFDESNGYLSAPEGQEAEVAPLSIWSGVTPVMAEDRNGESYESAPVPVIYSCWKFTKEELEEVMKTGRIWLGVIGNTMKAPAASVRPV